jgi:hypothetical protein
MEIENLKQKWIEEGLTPPKYLFLNCQGKMYCVIEDNSSIVQVMSKTRTVYAVAKSRLTIIDESYYSLELPYYLKVISCTENTNVKKNQKFVSEYMIKYL